MTILEAKAFCTGVRWTCSLGTQYDPIPHGLIVTGSEVDLGLVGVVT
jgi:hypothetical protein